MTSSADIKRGPADSMSAGLEVLEDATALLRTSGAGSLLLYYLGTLPFLWLLLEYCWDMRRSAHAARHIWPGACSLALAYIGMKVGHALFAQRLLLKLREDNRRWTLKEAFRVARRAAIVQSSALPITCLAACLLIPTAWTFAFYHHALCVCDAEQPDAIAGMRAALKQSRVWPRQNHALLTIHAVFGLSIFVNAWALLLLTPQLLQTLFGLETRFLEITRSPFNSAVVSMAAVVTVALADPLLKAAYVIRAFQAESINTGRDLTVAWRRTAVSVTLVIGLVCLLPCRPAAAQPLPPEPSPSASGVQSGRVAAPQRSVARDAEAEKLDRQLSVVLERCEFSWHMQREAEVENDEVEPSPVQAWLLKAYHSIGSALKRALRFIGRIVEWFLQSKSPQELSDPKISSSWSGFADKALIGLAILTIAVPMLLLIRRQWHQRKQNSPAPLPTTAAGSDNEGLDAAKLPESAWLQQADALLHSGERRLALRALFLSNLACLIQAGHLTAATYKSVGDYRRDLRRRAHVIPQAFKGFCDTASIFESVWYGNRAVTDEILERFSSGSALLRQNV